MINIETAEREVNPVDLFEHLADLHEWSFDRSGDDEITLSVSGRWADYHASFTWMDDIESLHLACAFDLKVPDRRLAEVKDLIQMINEQLWLGHFDLWPQEGVVMFRHALLLAARQHDGFRSFPAEQPDLVEGCPYALPNFNTGISGDFQR